MNEAIDKLLPVFEKLAQKIGESGEGIWKFTIEQQKLDAYSGLFWGLLWILLGVFLKDGFVWKGNAGFRGSDDWIIPGIIFWIPCLFIGMCMLIENIKRKLNPQYYALKDLLDSVKEQID